MTRPFMALDCRKPPNTLSCDRVYLSLATRLPMADVSVRVGDRTARLRAAGSHGDAVPGGMRRTLWMGYLGRAGLTRPGSPLEVALPPGRKRWTGEPPVAADLEVIYRRPGAAPRWWIFRDVNLLAGHG